jgi:hypothetical protein
MVQFPRDGKSVLELLHLGPNFRQFGAFKLNLVSKFAQIFPHFGSQLLSLYP